MPAHEQLQLRGHILRVRMQGPAAVRLQVRRVFVQRRDKVQKEKQAVQGAELLQENARVEGVCLRAGQFIFEQLFALRRTRPRQSQTWTASRQLQRLLGARLLRTVQSARIRRPILQKPLRLSVQLLRRLRSVRVLRRLLRGGSLLRRVIEQQFIEQQFVEPIKFFKFSKLIELI